MFFGENQMELFEKSMQTLELPAVLAQLSAEATSEPGKLEAERLRPSVSVWEVRERLAETSAAKALIGEKGNPSFHGVRNVEESLKRADIGGMLNTRELLTIAGLLRAARTVRAYAAGDRGDRARLEPLFQSLRGNKFLEDRITGAIAGEDELTDNASPALSDIRRKIRRMSGKVRETLQRIIASPAYSKALQEPIITQRSGRFVVPVKAEYKSALPGLTHDISSSGATLFIEPMAVVEANNEIRELEAEEQAEIERILMELSAQAAAHREDITNDYEILVALDVIFAKARLSFRQRAMEPAVTESGEIRLRRARHPLLPEKTAVPIDLALGGDFDTLVITGPNTGGKTVCLKTLGLLSLMVQCGLHIPTDDGSTVPVFEVILADIGDEQSIAQSLSTFSSHMSGIVKILEAASPGSLLLFDELGAGTDPVEGAALAISIIEYARGKGAKIAATTHYAELKLYATTAQGVQNAACEFDVETLRPTYRLMIGIPGKSNAFAISRRLGLPEAVIDDARGRIGAESASFEEVLADLEAGRQEMERDKLEAAKSREAARRAEGKAEALRRSLEETREDALRRARAEAADIIAEARRLSDEVAETLRRTRENAERQEGWQSVNDARAELRRRLNAAEDALGREGGGSAPAEAGDARPVRPGDTVELRSTGTRAQVIALDENGTLHLQAGIMKITASAREVRLLEERASKPDVAVQSAAKLRSLAVKPELDLRGMMGEEAIPVMERYLDSAAMSGLHAVTIIHGKGTGALRQAVHAALKRNRQVKGFRLGRYGEGETGVTIVEVN